jgi:GNAT superfamily N-acetyltransferase
LNQRDEERLAQLRTVFGQGRCVLLLATESDVPVGCCGLGAVNRTTAELKRLYVQPDFRYRGVGQLLLERAVSEAQEFGYDRIVLDVVATRYPAIALYRKAGWQPIPHWEGRSDMVAFEWLIRT